MQELVSDCWLLVVFMFYLTLVVILFTIILYLVKGYINSMIDDKQRRKALYNAQNEIIETLKENIKNGDKK